MMNRISEMLKKYLKKYVSTRTVFAMDVVLSAAASFLSALFAESLVGEGVFAIGHALMWMVIGAAGSALFVWLFRTYRIIIRHTTIRQLARFAGVSTAQAVFSK